MSSVLYKDCHLRLADYASYLWEMTLNVGLDVSLDNMKEWKWIWEKNLYSVPGGKVNILGGHSIGQSK
jgi:hypothetical protein